MTTDARRDDPTTDDQGVDRSLIREMLALSPSERLLRLQDIVEGVLEIRERNARRTLP
jgi:hypothetical protein